MNIKEIIHIIESFAPLAFQESYDNSGLQFGNPEAEVKKVLITLDITEAVVDEAIQLDCQLIIAHHPLIFKPIKKLTGANYVERTFLKAIQNNIALYAAHTNLDNATGGVNFKFAEKIGLKNVQILQPTSGNLRKLTVFVPKEHVDKLAKALGDAGAGQIGNYKDCSFRTEGIGAFTPTETANPFIGSSNQPEEVAEFRLEVIFPKHLENKVLNAMFLAHPYEEVAYFLSDLANENQEVGAGAIGELETEMTSEEFLIHLKDKMQLSVIRFTSFEQKIKKVAVCGGVGSFLLKKAIASKADAFVTADFKYHEFFDAEGRIMIADIGHFESEYSTKELFFEILTKKIPNIAILFSTVNTNPVKYYY